MAKSSFVPQYQVIYDNLKAKIQSGELAPGSQLPFERELCEAFSVQRITVRKALDMLVQDGLIYKRAGCGSFVNAPHRESEPAQQGTLLFVMSKSQNDIRSNSSAYNAQLFFLMEQMCRQSGYTLLYAGVSSAREIDALAEQYPIAGAFLVSTLDAEIVERHLALGMPLLCLNHHEARILSVLPDNEAGIAQAVSRLAALGHRRIAFVGGAPQSCNATERLHGFVSAMRDCGLAVEPALRDRGLGSAALEALQARYAPRPLVVDIEEPWEGAENFAQRQRRKAFYLRCGFYETPVRYHWRGEPYQLLSTGRLTQRDWEAFWQQLRRADPALSRY